MSPRPFLLLALVPGVASAAELDGDTFTLSGSALDDAGTLQLVSPHLGDPGAFYTGLGVVYAHQPVVWRLADGTRQPVVDGQLSTRIGAGYDIRGVVRLDLEVPVYPWVGVDGGGTSALGDVRLGAVVPIVRYEEDGVGLGVAPWVALPTASSGAWVSNGAASGGALVTLGGRSGRLGWDVNVGADLGRTATVRDTVMGSALATGAGLSVAASESFRAGLELTSNVDLSQGGDWHEDPLEGHVYGTYGTGRGMTATLGLGTGLIPGVGAPAFRGVVLVGYRNPGKPIVHDLDGDGLADDVDQCVNAPEDLDRFADTDGCPDPDNDKDGLRDAEDQCPDEAEDFDSFSDADGCPDPDNDDDGFRDDEDACPDVRGGKALRGCPDSDGDGITDAADACPQEPGPASAKGCPDRDADQVPDSRDKCPDEPADPRIDPDRSDGCPARVIVTKDAIQILDKIYFDTNKATIRKVSFPLLAEIAKVIQANPDIKLIEVGGHTDSQGNDAFNLQLSQARAEAVVFWLTTAGGVDSSRLVAKGYGETHPIDTNDDETGRAMNRRVEFNILDQ